MPIMGSEMKAAEKLKVKPGDIVRCGKAAFTVVSVTATDMTLNDGKQYPLTSPHFTKGK